MRSRPPDTSNRRAGIPRERGRPARILSRCVPPSFPCAAAAGRISHQGVGPQLAKYLSSVHCNAFGEIHHGTDCAGRTRACLKIELQERLLPAAYAARLFRQSYPWAYAHGYLLPPLRGSTRIPGLAPGDSLLEPFARFRSQRFYGDSEQVLIHMDAQEFFRKRLAGNSEHPQIRTRSLPEPASRAATALSIPVTFTLVHCSP